MSELLRWGFVGSVALSAVVAVGCLCTVTPLERPRYGHRGAERQRALDAGGLFATFEPAIRFVGALATPCMTSRRRERLTSELQRADDVLGLSAEELTALALLSATMLGLATLGIAHMAGFNFRLAILATVFGWLLPGLQVSEVIRARAKAITRALPPAIEIASMCMSAGLDFPGALRMLAERNTAQRTPLGREFGVILEHLNLGHTRKHALERFAERVPSRAVQDFVHAVIQAEQKGNPLARVLQVQGRMLNMRRSVAAEEAAARAGVLLIIPMVFLMGAILLLLMGPFIVTGIGF
jgi:tight adherence protein C